MLYAIASFVFVACLFTFVGGMFWYMDRRNNQRSKKDSHELIDSRIQLIQNTAYRIHVLFSRGCAELKREEDIFFLAHVLEQSTKIESICLRDLRYARETRAYENIFATVPFVAHLDKTEIFRLQSLAKDMEQVCDARKQEYETVLLALRCEQTNQDEFTQWATTMRESLDCIGMSHFDFFERSIVSKNMQQAYEIQNRLITIYTRLQNVLLESSAYTAQAHAYAVQILQEAEQVQSLKNRMKHFVWEAENAASVAPFRLQFMRKKFEYIQHFVEKHQSFSQYSVILQKADAWLSLSDAYLQTGSMFDARKANTYTQYAFKLLVAIQNQLDIK